MSFLSELRKDKMKAMKEKDRDRVNVITLLMSSISLAEKENKKELTDEEALVFVQKELKQLKDTLEATPDNRQDIIDETKRRIDIIEGYLPKQMTEEELTEIILNIIDEKDLEKTKKNKGIIIKEVLGKYKGKTDGKTVNLVIDKILE
ncbi:GatB/YqeY domain-containing protein [Miniphocaeibacter halophilus]|uniref:GatB/YqeY domain-containing protein n=1 Tax=Miniphocaeibacter halophilus TaxID=2931922 RepID=A0AC61MQN1_9FIRM|nr:GatB/YqeY domain-containing protein [Miniphocaeibacter halophilus]QQK07881.1 GatB/YqeY domain-containing protein [Miniphocaeibacter halophilus]